MPKASALVQAKEVESSASDSSSEKKKKKKKDKKKKKKDGCSSSGCLFSLGLHDITCNGSLGL